MITSVPAPIKSRVTQAAEILSFEDAIAANLSYSGFYCTQDLEQNAELRITSSCSPNPIFFALETVLIVALVGSPLHPIFRLKELPREFWLQILTCFWWVLAARGDHTKVRKLSGSRSCGDARALSNSSRNTIFKVPEGGKADSLQKSSVSRSKSDNQADAFHL
jgi:hypothetical protein